MEKTLQLSINPGQNSINVDKITVMTYLSALGDEQRLLIGPEDSKEVWGWGLLPPSSELRLEALFWSVIATLPALYPWDNSRLTSLLKVKMTKY